MNDEPSVRELRPRPAIEVQGLRRLFERSIALDGVDFTVRAGEIHALLGPNGAGKTTLLRTMSGLVAPTEGSVHVLGADVTAGTRALQGHVGLVPSGDRTFYLRISGLENLVFFARLQGLRRRKATARAHEVLAAVGLTDAARRRVGLYSKGMQKRLSIARALLTEPGVLLVDEATHDLDPEGAQRVRALIAERAAAGAAVMWATQRVDEISGFANRVTVLTAGRVRFTGSVNELLAAGGLEDVAATGSSGSHLENAFLAVTGAQA
ncbi:MAG TPA: ABC transporter ATP-binding protein [Solirubrobacteraceae bacterium]